MARSPLPPVPDRSFEPTWFSYSMNRAGALQGESLMKTVVIVLLVLALAAVGFIYSGIYDVAATTPDTGLIQWALETTQHRSVHRRAEQVEAPPSLDDPN